MGSKERFILVKTGLTQDLHSICDILRTQNVVGGTQNTKRNNPPLKSQRSNVETSIEE